MMKARAGDTYLFGLSELNLQYLKEGRPILINLNEIGGKGKVVIFYGETEEAMKKDLAQFMPTRQ